MLREIVLDTETTGLDPEAGHRIVEVAALELVNHVPTGTSFHSYVNPERDMPDDAFRVHGLSAAFLADFPLFGAVAAPLLDFLGDAPLVIHNAGFDLRFLNAELRRCGREPLPPERAVDTLALANRRFPGAPASLDSLCRRFAVDASARKLHGALLDCQLLAEVYLHLLGGRQVELGLAVSAARPAGPTGARSRAPRPPRAHVPTPAELAAHEAFVATLGPHAIWRQ